MELRDKIVEFEKYCKTCKYKDVKDEYGIDPCHECLNEPVNTYSRKPVKYEEKEQE